MKLHVRVMEARGLAARDSNGFSDPFVRLQLGSTRTRTSVVYRNLNPSWNEEFVFNVVDLDEELSIMVWDEDRFTDDFLGQVRIPVSSVLSAGKLTLYRSWFPLRKRNEKSKHPVTGMLLHSHFKPIVHASVEGAMANVLEWVSSVHHPQIIPQ